MFEVVWTLSIAAPVVVVVLLFLKLGRMERKLDGVLERVRDIQRDMSP